MARSRRFGRRGFRVRWPGGCARLRGSSPIGSCRDAKGHRHALVGDPDQGVCPDGHPCWLATDLGDRECNVCSYLGRTLICWEITSEEIETAAEAGAAADVVAIAWDVLAVRS